MQFRLLVFGFALTIMALPVSAKEYNAAASTIAAANDLRRLPASSVIPPIRQESSLKHDQILCLALAMYHEARGESEAERLAVAEVVYNRAVHTDSTICGTVWADNGSQFQWVKSSEHHRPARVTLFGRRFNSVRYGLPATAHRQHARSDEFLQSPPVFSRLGKRGSRDCLPAPSFPEDRSGSTPDPPASYLQLIRSRKSIGWAGCLRHGRMPAADHKVTSLWLG